MYGPSSPAFCSTGINVLCRPIRLLSNYRFSTMILNQFWQRSSLQETFILPHVVEKECDTTSTGIDLLSFHIIIVYRFIYRNNKCFCWWCYDNRCLLICQYYFNILFKLIFIVIIHYLFAINFTNWTFFSDNICK